MKTITSKKQVSLRIDSELYEHVKELAAKNNQSVNKFIETVLIQATGFYIPNEETIQAIEEAKRERPFLKGYRSTDELLKDLMK